MKVALMQRVLAGYRVPFFDMLSESLPEPLQLYAGTADAVEMIDNSRVPVHAVLHRAKNRSLFSGKARLYFQTDVLSWLRSVDPDVLIMEANLRYPMSAFAARWMRSRGRRVIGWGLGTGRVGGILAKAHLSRYDGLVTYSNTGKAAYAKAGFPSEKIYLAKNAVSARPRREMPQRTKAFVGGSPLVLYVGRLQERKRLDLLIRACSELPESVRPRLQIVGDGANRKELENLAKECYPNTLFSGALYGEALTEVFDRADLFVLPGTGGLALQQAMASALPLIAAEADGTQADLVRHENGIQVEPGDKEALKTAMIEMLSDPIRLRRMGAESFRIVREEINLESMTAAFLDAIYARPPKIV